MFECGGIRPALLHLEYEEEKVYGGRQFLPAKSWVSLPYYVMTLEDIEDTATHEVTHLIDPTHNPSFYNKLDRIKLSTWKPPPGVVVVSGRESTKTKSKKTRVSKTHCNYHLCNKKTKLEECAYCGGYFCKEHIMPKEPGHYNVDGSESPLFIHNPEWRNTDGHPCPVYVDYLKQKQKEEDDKYGKFLERLTKKIKKPEFKKKIELPLKHKEEIKISKTTKPSKKLKLFLEFAGLGLIAVSLIFYNMPRAKFLLGAGLLLLAISFMVKKK